MKQKIPSAFALSRPSQGMVLYLKKRKKDEITQETKSTNCKRIKKILAN